MNRYHSQHSHSHPSLRATQPVTTGIGPSDIMVDWHFCASSLMLLKRTAESLMKGRSAVQSFGYVKSLLMMMGPLLAEELTEDDIVTIACSNAAMPPPGLINRNHCAGIRLASRIVCCTACVREVDGSAPEPRSQLVLCESTNIS